MKRFLIQLQTADGIDFDTITALGGFVSLFIGPDYKNITAQVENEYVFWENLKVVKLIHEHPAIVICEGAHGWDDYLLLHHFNKAELLDRWT